MPGQAPVVHAFNNREREKISSRDYKKEEKKEEDALDDESALFGEEDSLVLMKNEEILTPAVQHITTPEQVRAIYMTSWVAATPSLRQKIINLIDTTEINTVIIDIKDDTGKITFSVDDNPLIVKYGSAESRIDDIVGLLQDLHDRNVYVIGRIAAFQDTYLAPKLPSLAVQRADGAVWRDKKGLAWFDAGAQEVWEYIAVIAEASYAVGFDEINIDYVRFPSDGNMKDIILPQTGTRIKSDVIAEFFAFLDTRLRGQGIPLSADVFGMTTTNHDDLGIGQVFEKIVPHVDFISPMIYPSHYPAHFSGYANPASVPYEIITIATRGALDRLAAMGEPATKLRPWLQDFNLGATYTADMVVAQVRAVADLGLGSWLMWDAANTYTTGAYGSLLEGVISNIAEPYISPFVPKPEIAIYENSLIDG
jgi:hypothetical protein